MLLPELLVVIMLEVLLPLLRASMMLVVAASVSNLAVSSTDLETLCRFRLVK
jgi:hypothetical protein